MALFMRSASRPILSKSTTTASAINNAALRSFTSNTSYQAQGKAPALADVKPDQGHIFDAKQKDFRENYSKKKREREQRERQYSESKSTPSSLSGSQNSPAADVTPLGDLSTHSSSETGEAAKQQTNDDGSKKQPGRLSSFIYGTEEGREMDRELERSFSQVLARGKYVHSIVFHEVKPDKVDEYTELVGSWYPKVAGMPENKVNLVGSWRTEVGDCDTFGKLEHTRLTKGERLLTRK